MNSEVKQNPGRGRPSLSDELGEETKNVKVLLPISQYQFISSQLGFSAASYIRYLIDLAMELRAAEVVGALDPSAVDVRAIRRKVFARWSKREASDRFGDEEQPSE